MMLCQVVDQFDTDTVFNGWLTVAKAIEDINEKRLKNAASISGLVSHHFVRSSIVEPFDEMNKSLLTDDVSAIAQNVVVMVDVRKSLEECEEFIADQFILFIRGLS